MLGIGYPIEGYSQRKNISQVLSIPQLPTAPFLELRPPELFPFHVSSGREKSLVSSLLRSNRDET